MKEYIQNTDLNLPPTIKKLSFESVFGKESPRTLQKNSSHILCLQDERTSFKYVVAFYPRCQWLKRLNGKLRSILENQGYKQDKLLTLKPGMEFFHNYVPPWVTTKNQKETFASLFLVFVNNGESVPIKLKNKNSAPASEGTSQNPSGT